MTTIKNILILGATGGIGTSIAHSLANKNISLILHGNSEQKLKVLEKELSPLSDSVKTYAADLSHAESTQSLTNTLTNLYKEFDWIINSAGYIDEKETFNHPFYLELVKSFTINTIAPIYITQALLSKLSTDGGLIMISSTASLWGNPSFPVYSATKGALNIFTLAIAKQFENTMKTAVAVCPAGTNTHMRERISHDAQLQQSPNVIAQHISNIVLNRSEFSNGDIIVIRNGKAEKFQ